MRYMGNAGGCRHRTDSLLALSSANSRQLAHLLSQEADKACCTHCAGMEGGPPPCQGSQAVGNTAPCTFGLHEVLAGWRFQHKSHTTGHAADAIPQSWLRQAQDLHHRCNTKSQALVRHTSSCGLSPCSLAATARHMSAFFASPTDTVVCGYLVAVASGYACLPLTGSCITASW